jgi:ubiquinone/menaquinone biosynthesis C-methylase UbiE
VSLWGAVQNLMAMGAGSVVGSQVVLRTACLNKPRPTPHQMAAALEHPLRMAYRDPAELLGLFGVMAGMNVLDLGSGSGVFTADMARMVGEQGMVHAVDIQLPMLHLTGCRLRELGLRSRVRLHHCGANSLSLPDSSIDLAIAIATLAQVPDRYGAFLELRRVLKPGARLAISEELPDPTYVFSGVLRRYAEDAGFQRVAKNGTPFCYNMVFVNGKSV